MLSLIVGIIYWRRNSLISMSFFANINQKSLESTIVEGMFQR